MLIAIDEDAARTSVPPAEHPNPVPAAPYAGFRAAVIGSCQVGGIASALRQLLAGAHVDFWHYGVTPGAAEAIAETIKGYDLVISQILPDMGPACLEPRQLQDRCHSFILLPIFGFPGFNPDCVLINDPLGGLVQTPLGPYNSSIVFASFVLGLDERKTKGLFNSFIYSKLGFFDAFVASRTAIVSAFEQSGFEIGNLIDRWRERLGCFMYTTNHPKGEVMWDMATLALSRAGLDVVVPSDAFVDQYLSLNAIWPVYPEIGRRLSTSGSLTFIKPGMDHYLSAARHIDLPGYISASFESYAKYDCLTLAEVNKDALGYIVRTIGSVIAKRAG